MKNTKLRRGRRIKGGVSTQQSELRDIHSRIRGSRQAQDGHNLHGTSVTALVAEHAMYSDWSEYEETVEDHVIPRTSLTCKQYLGIFPPEIEVEVMRGSQLNKSTGEMVETTDNRLTWKQDKTLLNRAKPFDAPLDRLYREGSVSVGLNKRKTVIRDRENVPMTDTVIGPHIDIRLVPPVKKQSKSNPGTQF